MLHATFQLNIPVPSPSIEKVDFNGFAIVSIRGDLGFSTRQDFTSLKPCSLIMLHVKSEHMGAVVLENKPFKWS